MQRATSGRNAAAACAVAAVVSLGAVGLPPACKGNEPDRVSVRIFRQGQEQVLSPEREEVGALVRLCEEQIASANDVLRLAVGDGTIRDLRLAQTVVEIIFPEPKSITVELLGSPVEVQRLLVPLSGELAGDVTTIFYGSGSGYRSGPLRNRTGTAGLVALTDKLAN